jgi:hypothetical protein
MVDYFEQLVNANTVDSTLAYAVHGPSLMGAAHWSFTHSVSQSVSNYIIHYCNPFICSCIVAAG